MTKNGMDPLLSKDDNTAEIVGPPTEEEMNSAITNNFVHVLAVVCTQIIAVRFKNRRPNECP